MLPTVQNQWSQTDTTGYFRWCEALVFRELAATAARDRRWFTRQIALGDTNGRAEIHVSSNTVFSSLLDLADAAVAFDVDAAVVRIEEIDVVRLDDIFSEFAGRSVFPDRRRGGS